MSRQLICSDMCKIVTWSDHHFARKSNMTFFKYELLNPWGNGSLFFLPWWKQGSKGSKKSPRLFHSLFAQGKTAYQMPATRVVWVDCQWFRIQCKWEIPILILRSANHVQPYRIRDHGSYPTDSPIAARLGLWSSLAKVTPLSGIMALCGEMSDW